MRYFGKYLDETEQDKKFNKMVDWLIQNGARLNKTAIRTYKEDQRGLNIRDNITEGIELVFIPEKCLMTKNDAVNCELVKSLLKSDSNDVKTLVDELLLPLYVLNELSKGHDSFFGPFLKALPRCYDEFPLISNPEE